MTARFPTIAAIQRAAYERLDRHARNYLEGGAGAERTLRWNEEAFAGWVINPRVLSGSSTADTRTNLFGLDLSMPIVVAPFGLDKLFHDDGLCAVARGAADAGTAAFISSSASFTLEAVHAAAPEGARFFQVSALGPVGVVERLAIRAADAGYHMLCMTVDTPRPGWRERTLEDPDAPNALDLASANYGPADYAERVTAAIGWTWETVAQVVEAAGMPWVAKGVLTAGDAQHAIAYGAAGIVVSNHGGRQLDHAPAALDALPEVAQAVDGRVPIVLDGGVRHGADVLIGLALGATAVGIGRPAIWGLTAAGAPGVTQVLNILREELEITMTLAGCSTTTQPFAASVFPKAT